MRKGTESRKTAKTFGILAETFTPLPESDESEEEGPNLPRVASPAKRQAAPQ